MFSWRKTHPVALKCIAKVPNQKVTRRPKCFSFFFFFFFFRRASSNLRESFTMVFAQKSSIFHWAVHQPIAFFQVWSHTRRFEPLAEEKWRRQGSHSSSCCGAVRISWCDFKAMGWCTARWKMLLFCAKTIVKESRKFELARLKKKKKKEKKKKKKKEKHFGRLVTFWFGTFAMLFSATGCVVRHKNTRRWTVGCYNGL